MSNYKAHNQQLDRLKELIEKQPNSGSEEGWLRDFNKLKDEIQKSLSSEVKHRFNNIDLDCYMDEHPFGDGYLFSGLAIKSQKMLIALLEDEIFYFAKSEHPDEKYLRKRKLIEARRESSDFESDLASIICGDNPNFPYRSSWYITKFFKDNGFNYEHDGSTRAHWIASVLFELNIDEIYRLTESVFKRKYFVDFARNKELDLQNLIQDARKSFSDFLENSISANATIDLSAAYKLNVNFELLSNKLTQTDDLTFNALIDSAKDFFVEGKKQEALEKVWDAFERLKTIILPTNKKKSAEKLIKILSKEIDQVFFEDEFKTLTNVGNNYMIRHSEVGKKPLTDERNKDYLFFRMLALIDLAIQKLPKE